MSPETKVFEEICDLSLSLSLSLWSFSQQVYAHMDSPLFRRFFLREDPFPNVAFSASAIGDAPVDWSETADLHVFKVDLPGLKKEDIQVQLQDGNVLQISGERKKDEDEATGTWHCLERPRGSFLRQFQLPDNIRGDEVKAVDEDGVLTIVVPKKQNRKPAVRKIRVSSKL